MRGKEDILPVVDFDNTNITEVLRSLPQRDSFSYSNFLCRKLSQKHEEQGSKLAFLKDYSADTWKCQIAAFPRNVIGKIKKPFM